MMLASNMLDVCRFVVLYREPNRKIEAFDTEREGNLTLHGPFTGAQADAFMLGKVEGGEWEDASVCIVWTQDAADAAKAVEHGHLDGSLFEYVTDHAQHYGSVTELRRYGTGEHFVVRLPIQGDAPASEWRVSDELANYLPRSLDALWERYEAEVVNATAI